MPVCLKRVPSFVYTPRLPAMFAAVVITALVAEGAYLPACVPLRSSCLPRRSAAVLLQASNFDGLIDELLAAPEEQVLSVMGQRLETIADGGFMAQLDRRRAAAGSTAEEQALVLLGGSVCDFMEELVQRMQAARIRMLLAATSSACCTRLLHPLLQTALFTLCRRSRQSCRSRRQRRRPRLRRPHRRRRRHRPRKPRRRRSSLLQSPRRAAPSTLASTRTCSASSAPRTDSRWRICSTPRVRQHVESAVLAAPQLTL